MGEIRIVGPSKTRGYPYPVCKNLQYTVANPTSLRNVASHLLTLGFTSLKVHGFGCRVVCFAK